MIKADKYYIENLKNILENGNIDFDARPKYKDGVEANTLFVTQVFEKYDISKGEFPITTLRNTAVKTGIREIQWIYQLQSNKLSDAHKLGIDWWDSWGLKDSSIGMRYGSTVKRYDLMNKVLVNLKSNPFGRRHIINLLQETDMMETEGLYPCAYETMWSCRVVGKRVYLDMHLNQRSSDYIMAGHINKMQYVALQMMVACHLGYEVGVFSHYVQNLHIYDRHIDAAKEIISREPIDIQPKLSLDLRLCDFYGIELSDFKITGIKDVKKIKSPLEIAI